MFDQLWTYFAWFSKLHTMIQNKLYEIQVYRIAIAGSFGYNSIQQSIKLIILLQALCGANGASTAQWSLPQLHHAGVIMVHVHALCSYVAGSIKLR